jgi:hypothetical protein|tara:strand:- start:272 stop:454 length:183 start_codon:yes stop_codon:yes gene_type:complete
MRIVNLNTIEGKGITKRSLLYLAKVIMIFAIATAATMVAQASMHDALGVLAHTYEGDGLE